MTTSHARAYGNLGDHEVLRVGFGAMQLEHGDSVDAVKLRYRSRPVPAAVSAKATGRHGKLHIELGEAFAGAAPGQTAVLLAGERIVGHGTIAVS